MKIAKFNKLDAAAIWSVAPPEILNIYFNDAGNLLSFHTTSMANAKSILENGPTPKEAVVGFNQVVRKPAFWTNTIPFIGLCIDGWMPHVDSANQTVLIVETRKEVIPSLVVVESSWQGVQLSLQPEDIISIKQMQPHEMHQYRALKGEIGYLNEYIKDGTIKEGDWLHEAVATRPQEPLQINNEKGVPHV